MNFNFSYTFLLHYSEKSSTFASETDNPFMCSFLFAPASRRKNSVHIDKSVYWCFAFDNLKKLRNFFLPFLVRTEVSNRCLPIWYSPYCTLWYWCFMLPYPRRLLVVYLTKRVMRRPRFVDKQLEVCVFCMYEGPQQGGAVGGWAKDERRSGEGRAKVERRMSEGRVVAKE